MTAAARLAFWIVLLAVAFVTLAPIEFRPVTGLNPQIERFAAFLVVTVPLMIGYPRHRGLALIGLVAAAGFLELGQNLVPGRHGRLHDVEAKVAGIAAGALASLVIAALLRLVRHGRGSRPLP